MGMIEETWRLPPVDTVFDLVFTMDSGAQAYRVAVTCRRPPVETQHVELHATRATPIRLHFQSGDELRGEMTATCTGNRRSPEVGVFARLDYDREGAPPVRHFEGLAFLRDSAGALAGEPSPPLDSPPSASPPDSPPGRRPGPQGRPSG